MDNLPLELLRVIFCFACADGGQTARALSSVSHRIRESLGNYKYHSLSVNGLYQMERLVATLKASEAPQVPIVNLCIGCDDVLSPEDRHSIYALQDPMILPRRIRQNMTEKEFNDMKAKYIHDIANYDAIVSESESSFMAGLEELLKMSKDTLRILSITLSLPSSLPAFVAPNLTSLAVTAHLPDEFFDPYANGIYPFPSLKRLRLGKHSCNDILLPKLPKTCPLLTHLRIRQSFAAPAILTRLLGISSEGSLPFNIQELKPLNHLQSLVVDISPVQDRTQAIVLNHITSKIRRVILSSDDRSKVLLTYLPTAETAEREWLVCITGDHGW